MIPDRMDPTPACLSDDVMAAVVEGSLEQSRHQEALSHLAECARCSAVVASIARVTDDPAVKREMSRLESAPRRRVYVAAIPVIAAAALILWVLPRGSDPDGNQHRAPVVPGAEQPILVEPSGIVAQAASFRWRSVSGARQYRVTLFNDRGDVVYEAQLPDTNLMLPGSVILTPGRQYLWKVEARVGFDRFQPSDFVTFSIAPRTSR